MRYIAGVIRDPYDDDYGGYGLHRGYSPFSEDHPHSYEEYEAVRKRRNKKALKNAAVGAGLGLLAGGLAGGKLGYKLGKRAKAK